MFEAVVLVEQLRQLGRQLDEAVDKLGELDMYATSDGCAYQVLREAHEDAVAEAFLNVSGPNVEARKMAARLKCVPSRLVAQDACLGWEKAKSRVRTQQAVIRMLHTRIDLGRSLLSHEKARMDLDKVT